MELLNTTKMQAGYAMGTKPNGRELLVVVIKGTFTIPREGEDPRLIEQQVPLIETDVFTDEPGFSAPLFEIDFAPHKPRCDVLLNGSAYAPGGRPAKKVPVRLRVGAMIKEFDVIGDRVWQASKMGFTHSFPQPFTVMPISYDRAFGGSDDKHPDKNKHSTYMPNPVGRGYHVNTSHEFMDGTPLPNTEESGKSVSLPAGRYRPMCFGVIGRSWEPRYKLAGTYDQNWLDNVFPFLPADFKEEYFQAAPADQWIVYPQGGEVVELFNLTPQGRTIFKLPAETVPVEFYYKNGDRKKYKATIDTLLFEPDLELFTMSWRVCLPLRRSLHEIQLMLAGQVPLEGCTEPGTDRRLNGKPYYKSLAELVAANQARGE